jgi:hypothetical protein
MVAKKAKPALAKPALLLSLGAAALLIGGGGAAYWYLSQPKAEPGDLPVGGEVIPQTALMAVSVSTDAGQWKQLREFGTSQSQESFGQGLADLRDRVLTANGFDYQQDIQPWVGPEVTVAFLVAKTPTATPPGTPNQQPVVVVLPIQDPLKAKQILEVPRTPPSGKIVDRAYKGFQIKESQGSSPQNYSITVLDGKFVVVTNDPKATDQTIDAYTSKVTLAETPGYSRAFGQVKTERPFGKLYVNLPAAAALTAANSGRTPPQNLEQIQQNQGLAATVALEAEGIRLKSVSWLKPNSQRKFEVRNTARIMPSRLPADTLVMASGGNLKKFWQDYTQGATFNPVTPINPEVIRSGLKSTVGMDWDQDFLPWMDSEFALALVAAPEGVPVSLPSMLILAKASDRRAAEATLKKLDDAMANRYKFKVEETQISGQTVTAWAIPQSGAVINRGWLDGDVAFLTLGAPIANLIVPRPPKPLADSEAFKKAIPTGLNPNNGHFYINVEQAVNSKKLPLLQFPPGNKDLVAAVRSIGVTAAISDERSSRYDVFVALQKAGAPVPLPEPTIPPTSPSPSP